MEKSKLPRLPKWLMLMVKISFIISTIISSVLLGEFSGYAILMTGESVIGWHGYEFELGRMAGTFMCFYLILDGDLYGEYAEWCISKYHGKKTEK